jgi:hypothetical protein
MEYTVDVKEEGLYSFDAEVASNIDGGSFHLSEYSFDDVTFYADIVEVPNTGGSSNFRTMHAEMTKPLTAGRHRFCLNIDKGGFYIKNLTFNRKDADETMTCTINRTPSTITVDESAIIKVNASSKSGTIANVKVYANNLLIAACTKASKDDDKYIESTLRAFVSDGKQAALSLLYEPTVAGKQTIYAIVTDKDGRSKISPSVTLTVNAKRTPYSGKPIAIPGVIQAENFDKGGEGFTFHDSDSNREGDKNYRSDSEGVDFVVGNNGTCIGYTAANEWLEYSINVKEAGTYSYIATVSSGTTNSGFTIGLKNNSSVISLAKVNVPQTGNNDWGTYKTVEGKLSRDLQVGEQILRITINGANCNIDKIELKCTTPSGINDIKADDANQKSYDLFGRPVNSNYKGIIIKNGKKHINR